MARLKKSLLSGEVVVELAGKQQQMFSFPVLGRSLRGAGSKKVGNTSLPGMFLAFDFEKKHVRVIEPMLYADGQAKETAQLLLTQFMQPEYVYDALTADDFNSVVRDAKDCVTDGNARLIQGAFPE